MIDYTILATGKTNSSLLAPGMSRRLKSPAHAGLLSAF